MNRRIRTAVLALLVGIGLPSVSFAGAVTPGEPEPGEGGDDVTTCDDDVAKAIADTVAFCQEDMLACGIDITDELNALEDEITAECNGDLESPDYECRVLDVQTLVASTITETRQDCLDQPSACGITLETVLADATFGETEPNDHIVSADRLTSAVPIVGQMYATADEDWYYIEAPQINSIITIWFEENPNGWHVDLLDEAGNRLAATDTTAGEEFSFETSVAQAGTYYVVVSNTGSGTDALYQMAAIVNSSDQTAPQPSYNFHDVETEPNDGFTTADPIASNVVTYGQLLDGNEYDVYRIDTPGNEIMHIDLCYENTTCFEEEAWAMFVVDSKFVPPPDDPDFPDDIPCDEENQIEDAKGEIPVANCMLTKELTTLFYDSSVSSHWEVVIGPDGEPIGGDSGVTYVEVEDAGYFPVISDHIYYLFEYGRFDGALVGKVDPSWGDETGIDLALVDPGTYYVIITPILERTDKGSIIQVIATKPKAPDIVGMVVDPYNDDQYTFRVTRTLLDPSVADDAGSALRATMNSRTGKLTIPEVNYAGDVYKMDLRLGTQGGRTFILEQVTPVGEPSTLP